jgi:hypothetical protein
LRSPCRVGASPLRAEAASRNPTMNPAFRNTGDWEPDEETPCGRMSDF